MENKGQSSLEYMILIALILMVVVTGIGAMYYYSQRSTQELESATIERIGVDILDSSEKVYYIGGDSWETLRLNIPSGVKSMYILNSRDIVIEYDYFGGPSQAVFFSDINLTTPYSGAASGEPEKQYFTDEFHPGLTLLRVVSFGKYVNISETK